MKIKKISVKNFIETLTDNELKNVVGGYWDPNYASEWTDHGVGTCGFRATYEDGFTLYGCNMSRAEALHYKDGGSFKDVNGQGPVSSWYCCDNCGSSSYCG